MSVSVSMPQLGESVTEGTVTRWLKREGEHVQADEPLLEVSTDKVDTEIPSPVSGVLRGITVAEDETVAVGAELAVIDEDGAGGGEASAAASRPRLSRSAPSRSSQPRRPLPRRSRSSRFRSRPPRSSRSSPQPRSTRRRRSRRRPMPRRRRRLRPRPISSPAISSLPAAGRAARSPAAARTAAGRSPHRRSLGQPYQDAAAYPPAGYDEPGNGQATAQFSE